jgi:hypothetical protein
MVFFRVRVLRISSFLVEEACFLLDDPILSIVPPCLPTSHGAENGLRFVNDSKVCGSYFIIIVSGQSFYEVFS